MFHYITTPIAEMRKEPSSLSKVVSQALFSEEIGLGSQVGGWVRILTPDHYVGWVKQQVILSRPTAYPKDLEITRLKAHIYKVPDIEYGPLLTLPHGTFLQLAQAQCDRWARVLLPDGQEAYIQLGDVEKASLSLAEYARRFLGLPYTWGGRSSFGYDCSGFVQMLCKKQGLLLPRDACEQILDPRFQFIPLKEVLSGDLLFWGRSPSEICHVGWALDSQEFIHASARENKPYLRISNLNDFEWSGHPKAHYPYRAAKRLSISIRENCHSRKKL